MATFRLWTIQNSNARAGDRGHPHVRVTRVTVGLLKEQQKFRIQFQFLELHVDFSIVDNRQQTTLTRARARAGDQVNMAAFRLWTIKNSNARARARAGVTMVTSTCR